jgi:hypothetical protein
LHRAGKTAVRAGSTVQDDFEQGLAAEAGAMVALALTQGHDRGVLAYAARFGSSMIWFGFSAG